MKFFLILWVCSAIHGSCIVPPITAPGNFNSHTECVSAGYKEGYNVFVAIDKTLAEKHTTGFDGLFANSQAV